LPIYWWHFLCFAEIDEEENFAEISANGFKC
jgi:hypothetical protein